MPPVSGVEGDRRWLAVQFPDGSVGVLEGSLILFGRGQLRGVEGAPSLESFWVQTSISPPVGVSMA